MEELDTNSVDRPQKTSSLFWRLLRMRLRTLLILAFLMAIVLAWCVNTTMRLQRRDEVLQQVTDSGARYRFDWEVNDIRNGPPGIWPLRLMFGKNAFAKVEKIYFENAQPDEDCLKAIESLKHLKEINISNVTDQQLAHIGKHSSLQLLTITSGEISEQGAKHLANLGQLRELAVFNRALGPDSVEAITQIPNLKRLGISGALNSRDVLAIGKMKNLEMLNLSTINAGSIRALKKLSGLSSLKTLMLGFSGSVTNDDLHWIRSLPNLRWLYVSGGKLDSEAIILLSTLDLERLDFSAVTFSENGFELLADHCRTKSLTLGSMGITDSHLEILQEMTHLEELRLMPSLVTDAGFEAMLKFPNIREVEVGNSVTEAGALKFQTRRPNCKVLAVNAVGKHFNFSAVEESE